MLCSDISLHYKPLDWPGDHISDTWKYSQNMRGIHFFTPHTRKWGRTHFAQNCGMTTITHTAGYRLARHEWRTKEERDLPLRMFLLTEQYSDCGTSWKTQHQTSALPHEVHPECPAEKARVMRKDMRKREGKKAKQTREFRRGSHAYVPEVNPPGPHCWHLSLWHLQLQPLSRQGWRVYVCVCAHVCV